MDALEQTTKSSENLRGSYFPPLWVGGYFAVTAIGIAAVRRLQIDMAVINIVTLILICMAAALLLAWFCFRSGYSPALRWSLPVLLLVGASVFSVRYRATRTNGSLIPTFVRRGAPLSDEILAAQPEGEVKIAVDLATTTGADFPRFLGPMNNSSVPNIQLDRDWNRYPPEKLWSREIGAGWSGFAAVNGYALTLEQRGPLELVTCYAIETGEPCWSHAVETRHETLFGFVGPRSTPTIHEGRVYAMGANGVFRCLDGLDGTEIWRRDLFSDYGMTPAEAQKAVAWGRANSPLIVGNTVVIPVGGPRGGKCVSIIAMHIDTGDVVWESGQCQASYASPALWTIAGVSQIVSVNEGFVSGHDIETGEVLWEYPWPGRSDMDANVSQPHALGENQLWLSKGYSKGAELLALERSTEGAWNIQEVWAKRVMKTKFSNVAIRDGYAYGLDDGILCCVDVETGDRVWKKGRYKYGQVLLVDDLLLVMTEDGEVVLVEATPAEHRELGRFQALDGQSWNTICLYGDRLLVRNSEQAACYRLKLVDDGLVSDEAP